MDGNIIEVPDMKFREDELVDKVYKPAKAIFHNYYNIIYKNTENLQFLKDKPFVVLSEHERYWDTPLTAILIKETIDRYAYFLMRSDFPKFIFNFFERRGGIPVGRTKDIKKGVLSREEARIRNIYVFEKILPYVLAQLKDRIVNYVSVQRNRNKPVTEIKKKVIERMLEVEKRIRVPIWYIVLGLYYENVKKPRSEVIMRLGEPFQASDDGLEKITEEISKTFFKPVEFV